MPEIIHEPLPATQIIERVKTDDPMDGLRARELQHRIANIFGLFHALIKTSAKGSRDLEEFVSDLGARVDALALSQRLGMALPGRDLMIREVVTSALDPFIQDHGQTELSGPDIKADSVTASTLSLVLHELTTNAVKHGALRTGDGKIAVRWKKIRSTVAIEWSETCAMRPPPIEPSGFGFGLIKSATASLPSGRLAIDMTQQGLQVHISFDQAPVSRSVNTEHLPSGVSCTPQRTAPNRGLRSLDDLTVLVAEDDPIIAMDMEQMLVSIGFGKVDIVSTCVGLENSIRSQLPDLLILDLTLPDGSPFDVAKSVTIDIPPIIAATGQTEAADLPVGTPLLQKPFSETALAEAVHLALGPAIQ